MIRFVGRSAALLVLLLAGSANAADTDMAEARTLYIKECSKCHGTIDGPDAMQDIHQRGPLVKAAFTQQAPIRAPQLAFSFPYGPNLKGIVGRTAGTVPNYNYSKAFMRELEGAVWTRGVLDAYLTDSQVMAPGIIMFYRQPDQEIRTKIIEYLASGG
jgi:hypothetical protein